MVILPPPQALGHDDEAPSALPQLSETFPAKRSLRLLTPLSFGCSLAIRSFVPGTACSPFSVPVALRAPRPAPAALLSGIWRDCQVPTYLPHALVSGWLVVHMCHPVSLGATHDNISSGRNPKCLRREYSYFQASVRAV